VDTAEIRALLQEGVGPEIAFVPEKSAKLALSETLSALANAHGGTVLLGVTMAGAVRGVREPDAQCEQALSAALFISPPLVLPLPQQITVDSRTVIAIQVPPGLPNVYATEGRYLVRDGQHNRPLKAAEVHELMALRGIARFETQVPATASPDSIDWDRVRQYVNKLQHLQDLDAKQILQRRGCLADKADGAKPTYAGLLLFGQVPSQWVVNAEITAIRYPGREMGDEFVREDISGPLPDQIRKAEAFLKANTVQEVVLQGLTREEYSMYPEDVLREAVVNAVAHRDYTVQGESTRIFIFGDRVEVYSPGKLPGHVTVENIVQERFSRNPVIVQVLSDMGFIERLGYGIDRMLRLLNQAGHPPPYFEETGAGFRVTIYARTAIPEVQHARWAHLELNPRQELALRYVIEHGRITNREYNEMCPDVSAETIRRDLSDLVHKDALLRIGRKRATYYILKDATLAEG
jgi:ATP-dependent DNA helicase RecG